MRVGRWVMVVVGLLSSSPAMAGSWLASGLSAIGQPSTQARGMPEPSQEMLTLDALVEPLSFDESVLEPYSSFALQLSLTAVEANAVSYDAQPGVKQLSPSELFDLDAHQAHEASVDLLRLERLALGTFFDLPLEQR